MKTKVKVVLCKDSFDLDEICTVQDFAEMMAKSRVYEGIKKSFLAEGWKEVPVKERKNAEKEIKGWIDERNMVPMEPRKGTRYFLIDSETLTWKFFFKRSK